MEILIVSKTHMSNAACVGGLSLLDNRYVRLLNPGNYNQPTDTDFNIGDIWDISFVNRANIHPPHIEDIIVTNKSYLRKVENITSILTERNLIDWRGHINNLFGGLLHWTNSGTGYIPLGGEMPSKSVGFWLVDKELVRVVFDSKTRFRYPNSNNYRNISYVGYQDTLSTIPAGTILRVSLSRLFPPENSEITTPRGYYLQLSGWYINTNNQINNNQNNEDDDLPF